jgi:DNA-binding transcriptional regulator YdaS (Cro superfamily)
MSALPVPAADPARRIRLLRMVVDALDTQAEAARMLCVEPSTLSQWLSGKRCPEWHMVHEAVKRTLRRRPELAPVFVEVFASEILDLDGSWKPRPDEEVGDFTDESSDVTVAHGRLTEAVRARDPKRIEAEGRGLVREAEEATRAGLRMVAGGAR